MRFPTNTALQLSCSAPASISLALAVDSLTNTVNGAEMGPRVVGLGVEGPVRVAVLGVLEAAAAGVVDGGAVVTRW